MHASYLEIYNEDIRDLLGEDIKKKLNLKEHPERGVYVQVRLNTNINRPDYLNECKITAEILRKQIRTTFFKSVN